MLFQHSRKERLPYSCSLFFGQKKWMSISEMGWMSEYPSLFAVTMLSGRINGECRSHDWKPMVGPWSDSSPWRFIFLDSATTFPARRRVWMQEAVRIWCRRQWEHWSWVHSSCSALIVLLSELPLYYFTIILFTSFSIRNIHAPDVDVQQMPQISGKGPRQPSETRAELTCPSMWTAGGASVQPNGCKWETTKWCVGESKFFGG